MILAAITTHKRMPDMVKRALKSVIAQTYTDWELVVVDDSPPDWEFRDDVRKMVKGYAEKDSRIRYVAHDRNYGAQRARNNALKIADEEGFEFIAYLDDDDEWLPEKLEKQFAKFQKCDEYVAAISCEWVIRDEKNYKSSYKPKIETMKSMFNISLEMGPTSAPLLRTKHVIRVGGFDEAIQARQDWDLWLRLTKRYDMSLVHEVLYVHYLHEGEHVGGSLARQIQAHERLLSKYFCVVEEDMLAYRNLLVHMSCIYASAGKFGTSIARYFKAVKVKPFMVKRNIGVLLKVMYKYVKFQLETKIPSLFGNLKNMKQKLKGGEDS